MPATSDSQKPRLVRRLCKTAVAVIAFTAFTYLIFLAAIAWWPYPEGIASSPGASTLIVDRTGVPLAAFAAPDGQWRFPLREDEINPHLLAAIVAVEDARFADHAGVDWTATAAAA